MLTLEEIKNKYGHVCSFAIWKKNDKTQKPKYGIGDISHFDILKETDINRNIILVGLNLSGKGTIDKPFSNFHNPSPTSNDYRLRYAIEDSYFSGGYMTDIIKDYEEVMSGKVMKYLKNNPDVKKRNIDLFEMELNHLGTINPIIIAFGNDTFKILNELKNKYQIFKVPHYSSSLKKDELRNKFNEIKKHLGKPR